MPRLALTLALAGSLLALPSASLGAVRIGEPADQPNTGMFAGLYCVTGTSDTFATTQAPTGVQVTSPIDGVIVQWRMRHSSGPALTATLRVLHPGAPGQFTGAGTSAQTAPFTGLGVFPTRLPIAAGDYIGVDLPCSAAVPHQTLTERNYPSGGASVGEFTSALADGGPLRAPSFNDINYTAVMDADIEPDADHDGYGDETQDGCPTQAVTHGACIVPVPPIKDVKAPKAGAVFRKHWKLHDVLVHGLRGVVKSNEAGSATATALISLRAAHQVGLAKLVKVAAAKQTIPAAGSVDIELRFHKKIRHKLRRAHRLVMKIRVVVKDASGNATVVNRTVRLRH